MGPQTLAPSEFNRSRIKAVLNVDGEAVSQLNIAGTALRRLRGMFFRDIPALLIIPCNSVHAIGFTRTLDVAYVSKDGTVLGVRPLRPWTMHAPVKGAHCVLEATPGLLAQWGVRAGSILTLAEAGT